MSLRYKGGVISATPPTTTGGESGTAPGVWTVEQQFQAQGAGNWPVPYTAKYIEDYFSTWLYDGNSSTQVINNGIPLGSGSAATSGVFLSQGTGTGVFPASDGSYAAVTANSVSKINADNTIAWTKTDTNKTFHNVRIDSSGNVYVTCFASSTVFVAKYNSSGTAQWIVSTGSSVSPDDVVGMALTSDGNLFLGWGSSGGVSMKMSSADGSITWQKSVTGTNVKLQDVCADSSGNCYQLIYSGSTRVNNVIKFDSSGNTTWQKQITSSDGSGGFFCYGIGVDSSSNVYVNAYAATGGTNKNFIYKLDSSGSVSAQRGWPATPSLGASSALCVDSSNNVYVSMNNGYVMKYNSSLSLQWVRNFNISAGRRGLNPNTTDVFYMSEGSVVVKLALDGSTNQGYSTNGSYNYYTPPITDASTSAVSSTNSSLTISNSAYSSSSTTFANDYSITGTALTFPAIPASNGGMVWFKNRNGTFDHAVFDTSRGATKSLRPNSTVAEATETEGLTAFNSSGFTLGGWSRVNTSGSTYVSWTFREQPKFFDIVTFTGTGNTSQYNHNLGSTPGCIIVKNTSNAQAWYVYHRSLSTPVDNYLLLNSTNAVGTISNLWGTVNSTQFGFSGNGSDTYVAYLFAHDAGGFGLTGSDNVISCGSFTTDGSGNSPVVNLGYEPQWLLVKQSGASGSWYIIDTMRAWNNAPSGSTSALTLYPNLTNAEAGAAYWNPTSTGFYLGSVGNANTAFIYIAIRRGPMKTPTSGTSVFAPVTLAANGATNQTLVSTGFPVDLQIGPVLSDGSDNKFVHDRLRGGAVRLYTNTTGAEEASNVSFDWMTGMKQQQTNATPTWYMWRRAPSFFDEVCYTGNGSTNSQTHNLGVIPDLVICKKRSGSAQAWAVYCQPGGTGTAYNGMSLNDNLASANSSSGNFTSTTFDPQNMFTSSGSQRPNSVGENYVAYLFATCAGVSKVGSYTGTGTTLQVNCGFTNGSRFVLIKRTDSTGDWYVWDSARGIVAGNDPYLLLNSTAAEVTNTDYVDTYSAGFEISSTAPAAINANGGTFIFLAIA